MWGAGTISWVAVNTQQACLLSLFCLLQDFEGADDGEKLWDGKKDLDIRIIMIWRGHGHGPEQDLLKQMRKLMQPLPKFLRQTQVVTCAVQCCAMLISLNWQSLTLWDAAPSNLILCARQTNERFWEVTSIVKEKRRNDVQIRQSTRSST